MNAGSRGKRRTPTANIVLGGMALATGAYLLIANTLPRPEPYDPSATPGAWGRLQAVLATLPDSSKGTPLAEPTSADLGTLRTAISGHERTLSEVRTLMREPLGSVPLEELDSLAPAYRQIRTAARMFVAQSRLEQAAGDQGAAMERALDALELGAAVGKGPFIHYLVGAACTSTGIRQAEACVTGLSADAARNCGVRLDAISVRMTRLPDALGLERRLLLRGYQDAVAGRQVMGWGGSEMLEPEHRVVMMLYPKSLEYAQLDRCLRELIAHAESPYPPRRPFPDTPFPLARILLRALKPAPLAGAKQAVQVRLLRLQLALRERRAAEQSYPERLDELAPRYVSAVPLDPFSGNPFRYSRKGRDYLLYSVGPDGKEDSGQPVSVSGVKEHSRGDLVAGKLYLPRPVQEASPGTQPGG